MSDHASKACTKCGAVKLLEQFSRDQRNSDGHQAQCHECKAAVALQYRRANREMLNARDRQRYDPEKERQRKLANRETRLEQMRHSHHANREMRLARRRRQREQIRAEVFGHYGTSCSCCGATSDLTIDHVNGDGAKHRYEVFGYSGGYFYGWLVKQGLPDGYQTLCFPCNRSKARGSHCRLAHELKAP